jgi:hypothetical protein
MGLGSLVVLAWWFHVAFLIPPARSADPGAQSQPPEVRAVASPQGQAAEKPQDRQKKQPLDVRVGLSEVSLDGVAVPGFGVAKVGMLSGPGDGAWSPFARLRNQWTWGERVQVMLAPQLAAIISDHDGYDETWFDRLAPEFHVPIIVSSAWRIGRWTIVPGVALNALGYAFTSSTTGVAPGIAAACKVGETGTISATVDTAVGFHQGDDNDIFLGHYRPYTERVTATAELSGVVLPGSVTLGTTWRRNLRAGGDGFEVRLRHPRFEVAVGQPVPLGYFEARRTGVEVNLPTLARGNRWRWNLAAGYARGSDAVRSLNRWQLRTGVTVAFDKVTVLVGGDTVDRATKIAPSEFATIDAPYHWSGGSGLAQQSDAYILRLRQILHYGYYDDFLDQLAKVPDVRTGLFGAQGFMDELYHLHYTEEGNQASNLFNDADMNHRGLREAFQSMQGTAATPFSSSLGIPAATAELVNHMALPGVKAGIAMIRFPGHSIVWVSTPDGLVFLTGKGVFVSGTADFQTAFESLIANQGERRAPNDILMQVFGPDGTYLGELTTRRGRRFINAVTGPIYADDMLRAALSARTPGGR